MTQRKSKHGPKQTCVHRAHDHRAHARPRRRAGSARSGGTPPWLTTTLVGADFDGAGAALLLAAPSASAGSADIRRPTALRAHSAKLTWRAVLAHEETKIVKPYALGRRRCGFAALRALRLGRVRRHATFCFQLMARCAGERRKFNLPDPNCDSLRVPVYYSKRSLRL